MMLRRLFLHLFVLMSSALPVGALAQTIASGERIHGDPNAPVTIVEYASLTCAHCAQFHLKTFPEIKKTYIDTGKVRWIFRDFPLDRIALRAAHLGRCLPPERIEGFFDALFRYQDNWAGAKEPEEALIRMAKLAGLTQEKVDSCLADKTIEDRVLEQRLEGTQKFGIDSTPSFIVDGKKLSGVVSFAELEKLIEKAK